MRNRRYPNPRTMLTIRGQIRICTTDLWIYEELCLNSPRRSGRQKTAPECKICWHLRNGLWGSAGLQTATQVHCHGWHIARI